MNGPTVKFQEGSEMVACDYVWMLRTLGRTLSETSTTQGLKMT